MKKFIPSIILPALLALLTLPCSDAFARDALGDRRTLFVPFGQKMLMFELPQGLCFLDASAPLESGFVDGFKAKVKAQGKGQLMGFFTDCLDIAGLGVEGAGNGAPPFLARGTIIWMNPYIGETFTLGREKYLDVREASFARYIPGIIGGGVTLPDNDGTAESDLYDVDSVPHRTQDSVSLAYRAPLSINFEKYNTTAITATTVLRDFPVEITMSYSTLADGRGKPVKSTEELYQTMDGFIAQQISLNDHDR